MQVEQITFIILSAGFPRTRVKSPIALSLVGKKVLIDDQVKKIKSVYPHSDIVLCLGYESKCVLDHIHKKNIPLRIVENLNYKDTSSVESLRLAVNSCYETDLFIFHGDRIFDKDSIVTNGKFTTSESSISLRDKVGIAYQDGVLKNLSYGISKTWSEMFFMPKSYFNTARKILNNIKSNIGMYEFINKMNKDEIISITKGRVKPI